MQRSRRPSTSCSRSASSEPSRDAQRRADVVPKNAIVPIAPPAQTLHSARLNFQREWKSPCRPHLAARFAGAFFAGAFFVGALTGPELMAELDSLAAAASLASNSFAGINSDTSERS